MQAAATSRLSTRAASAKRGIAILDNHGGQNKTLLQFQDLGIRSCLHLPLMRREKSATMVFTSPSRVETAPQRA